MIVTWVSVTSGKRLDRQLLERDDAAPMNSSVPA
jgi:hypothetical protein